MGTVAREKPLIIIHIYKEFSFSHGITRSRKKHNPSAERNRMAGYAVALSIP
jgi:hypothetical protein